MLLLIDAGNTRIKWAIAHDRAASDVVPGDWAAHGAVPHAEIERLVPAWAGQGVRRAIVANVAGAAVEAELDTVLAGLAIPVIRFASRAELAGMRNRYREPARLGADRFAAALGARALASTFAPGRPLIVATCGTATTIDAVSADGEFLGGMILPGLGLMLAALARGTAQLPLTAPDTRAPPAFADNTVDAIRSGCLSAQAGAIERACAALPGALCIVSGGAAAHVAPLLSVPCRMQDNIVLTGLQVAASAGAGTDIHPQTGP